MISCSRLEANLKLCPSALKSFYFRNRRFSKIIDISHEPIGVRTPGFFHVIVDPKCLSTMSFSRLVNELGALFCFFTVVFFFRNSLI